MRYICVKSVDWADEFDVEIGQVIDEDTYKKYKYMKDTLGSFEGYFGFGSNESFDDFDYLAFDFVPITAEEYAVLKKFGLPQGHGFIDNLFWKFTERLEEEFETECTTKYIHGDQYFRLRVDLDTCSFSEFKYFVDKYAEHIKTN